MIVAEKSAQKWIGPDRLQRRPPDAIWLAPPFDHSTTRLFHHQTQRVFLDAVPPQWPPVCARSYKIPNQPELTVSSARGAAANAPTRSCVRAPPPRDNNTEVLANNRNYRTRKTKEVDFGFSFGGPSIGLPGPAQPAIISEPAIPSQSKSNPTPSASTAAPQTVLSQTETSQRTPRGARNHLPQRPSAYDIPPDDVPNLNRSNKRRKISRL